MNLISGEPFKPLSPRRPTAAIRQETGGDPVSGGARAGRALGRGNEAATRQLRRAGGNQEVPYAVRLEAAQAIGKAVSSGSGELNAIAAGTLTPTTAEHPYYVRARQMAADRTASPVIKLRLLREALAIDPRVRRRGGRWGGRRWRSVTISSAFPYWNRWFPNRII